MKSSGCCEEAIASYQKSLEFLPDDAGVYYDIARCYALMVKVEWTVKMLQRAIDLDEQYRENAKTDTDFDSLRDDPAFQALLPDEGD
ncbi:MAG: hypothetical protein Fur0046_11520 [Cyanobacteria bacterium J069]|nr:MAG: hypothetical protein D6742_17780 [Cyanobacteria bacterium J069]